MKRFLFFSLLLAFIATLSISCSCTFNNQVNGSGHVTRVEYRVEPFKNLNSSIVMDAIIIQGNTEKVIVETDENLQQYIIVESGSNSLNLRMKKHVNIGKRKAGKIYIYTKGLVMINNSSVGKLTTQDTLIATKFKLDNSSVGNTDVKIRAQYITVKNSAVGSTNLYLQCEDLDMNNSAVGKTELTGSSVVADIKNSSVGNFIARNLSTQILHIDNSAIGKTEIYAEKELYIDNTAIGKMDVYGQGVIKRINDKGMEKINRH